MAGPGLSVIIPVYNHEGVLEECLNALFRSECGPFEVIVVDDASTDRSAAIASAFPCRVIPLRQNIGAAGARNEGARESRGGILVFIDADIVIQPDTLRVIQKVLSGKDAAAVVGIYSARHRNTGTLSQYKNMWIRYSYVRSRGVITWIFTSITGIARGAFFAAGGFDTRHRSETGIDDIELGLRLSEKGYRILLDTHLEVEHLKRFCLTGFIRNQFTRSRSFTLLSLTARGLRGSARRGGIANVSSDFTLGIIAAYLTVSAALAALFWKHAAFLALAFLLFYGALNVPFLVFYRKGGARGNSVMILAALFLDHLVCGAGIICGVGRFIVKKGKGGTER